MYSQHHEISFNYRRMPFGRSGFSPFGIDETVNRIEESSLAGCRGIEASSRSFVRGAFAVNSYEGIRMDGNDFFIRVGGTSFSRDRVGHFYSGGWHKGTFKQTYKGLHRYRNVRVLTDFLT